MKRYSLYLDEELMKKVKGIADDRKRSVSFMVSYLLQQSVKELFRKKEKNKSNV